MSETELPSLSSLRLTSTAGCCATLEETATPGLVRTFTKSVIFLLMLFFFALIFVPWQQTSVGSGKVAAYSPTNRQQSIEAPIAGRIKRWNVREGQPVKKGEALVEIADIDPQIMNRLENQMQAAIYAVKAAEKALEYSQKNLERQERLANKGLSSQRKYELAQIEVSKHQSELSSAQAKEAEIQTKLARQSSQTITADQDGVVVRILAPEGGVLVKAGDALATLVPDTEDRVVELLIPGNDLPLITPGRKVRLQFEGWPAVQFSGWPSVAVGTFGGVVRFVDAVDDGHGNYRIIVFPDPDEPNPWPSGNYLRQGVRVVGWVLLDTVPLGWEFWRRLNGFPPTVSEQQKKQKDFSGHSL